MNEICSPIINYYRNHLRWLFPAPKCYLLYHISLQFSDNNITPTVCLNVKCCPEAAHVSEHLFPNVGKLRILSEVKASWSKRVIVEGLKVL